MYATTTSGQILTFRLDPTTGSLGSPTSIPGPSNSGGLITIAPTGVNPMYLYVSDPQDSAVHVYSVNSADGTLTPAHIGPFSLGNGAGTPGEMATFFTSGYVIYVADSTGSIVAFNVNGDGSLTSVTGSPFVAGAGASHLAAVSFGAPNTSFLYVANTSDPNGSISAFSITTSGGLVPVPGSPFPTLPGAGPEGFFTGGKFLYVALKNANAIAAFAIANDGSLNPITGSPFSAGHGTFSLGGAGFLLATNNLDGTISSYSIDPISGILTQVAGSPFLGVIASGDAFSLFGTLFVPNAGSNSINGFVTDSTGAVSPMMGSPFQAGASPVALTMGGFPVVDPPGAH